MRKQCRGTRAESPTHRKRCRIRGRALVFAAGLAICLLLSATSGFSFPGEEKYLSSKAISKYNSGDYQQSEELFSKAAERDPRNPVTQYNLGSTQVKNGKITAGMEQLKKVYDDKNNDLNGRARFNTGSGHHLLARKAMEAAAPKDPKMMDAAKQAREVAMKELESALDEYRSAILASPQDQDMKYNYEVARQELDQLKRQEQQGQQNKDKQNQDKQDKDKQDKDKQQQDKQQQQNQDKDKQQQKDQQNQDKDKQQQDKQDQEKKDQEKKDQQQKDEQNKQDNKNEKEKQQAQAKQTPAPKPEQDDKQENDQNQQVGEMSPQDVERMLNSLPPEDQKALQRFMNAHFRSRGDMDRDW